MAVKTDNTSTSNEGKLCLPNRSDYMEQLSQIGFCTSEMMLCKGKASNDDISSKEKMSCF